MDYPRAPQRYLLTTAVWPLPSRCFCVETQAVASICCRSGVLVLPLARLWCTLGRMRKLRAFLLTLPLTLTFACGADGDVAGTDASSIDAASGLDAADPTACVAPDLDVQDDGTTQGHESIVISEINPGDYVELFNRTDQPVDVAMLTDHQWCSFPSYRPVRDDAITIPGKGYATIPFPTSGQNDTDGELVLYATGSYMTGTDVLDYVCWGNGETLRRGTAEGNPAGSNKWNGGCVASIPAGGSLHRIAGNNGKDVAHYEVTANNTPETCAP